MQQLIAIAIALIVCVIGVLAARLLGFKLSEGKLAKLASTVYNLVLAAEQLFPASGSGKAKKEYVLSELATIFGGYLNKHFNEAVALIESSVRGLSNGN